MSNELETPKVRMLKDFAKVQAELQPVIKDSKNPFFKSTYADLNSILDVVLPILAKHNFVLDQSTTSQATSKGMENIVMSRFNHILTGEKIDSVITIPQYEDMQKLGGAITYARRYTLCSGLSIRVEDDDGNTAVGKAPPAAKPARSNIF